MRWLRKHINGTIYKNFMSSPHLLILCSIRLILSFKTNCKIESHDYMSTSRLHELRYFPDHICRRVDGLARCESEVFAALPPSARCLIRRRDRSMVRRVRSRTRAKSASQSETLGNFKRVQGSRDFAHGDHSNNTLYNAVLAQRWLGHPDNTILLPYTINFYLIVVHKGHLEAEVIAGFEETTTQLR